jgi:cell division inhibitor SepF
VGLKCALSGKDTPTNHSDQFGNVPYRLPWVFFPTQDKERAIAKPWRQRALNYIGFSSDDGVELDDYYEPEEEATVTPIAPFPVQQPRIHHGDLNRIVTKHPRTYNEAKEIGETFRSGVPVILNMTNMADADVLRLVDFSGGLTLGLNGHMERITSKVFLLTPESVRIAHDSGNTGEVQV